MEVRRTKSSQTLDKLKKQKSGQPIFEKIKLGVYISILCFMVS